MSAFAQSVREATHSKSNKESLVHGTVKTILSYVSQAFRSNSRSDPRLDEDGKTCFLLQEQFRGYKNQDGNKKKQKAIPASVLRVMHENSFTPWEKALTDLLILALFFAMRSCEYMETRYPEEDKRTKILRLENIVFKKKGKVKHSTSLKHISSAELVIITFQFQKNDWRNHSVHMWSTSDGLLCPVKAAARIIKRVRSIPTSKNDTTICSFLTDKGDITQINSAQALPRLRFIVDLIGEDTLGFTSNDIGLHSIRSGGAMAMVLSGISTIIIQRVGRWSSEAFLEYIREQIDCFTYGVSEKMLQFEHFHNLNAKESQTHQEDEFNDIFVEDKGDGRPVDIDHHMHFSDLSLGKKASH